MLSTLEIVSKKLLNLASKAITTTCRTGKIFVVQGHKVRKLHHDFRIEVGGVLKCWSIPKGFPNNYRQKRLAIETEDHPMKYASSEESIPEWQYRVGLIEIWDKGTFENISRHNDQLIPINDALANGHLDLLLHGHILRGKFTLTFSKEYKGKKQWLLRKSKLLN